MWRRLEEENRGDDEVQGANPAFTSERVGISAQPCKHRNSIKVGKDSLRMYKTMRSLNR
ncbi:hypothetical protein J2Y83_003859 [Pseudomonas marginalis]|nr:hypothetical protein [Pseudomonas marginalis]MCP1525390.1 hypothetical protein [Pseudomonas marginalis]MDQ0499296.1 hypothetical protein [Pseudomonas marginalis]